MLGAILLSFAGYIAYLDIVVTSRFEGNRWEVPSRVYARPLEIYPSMRLSRDDLVDELRRINYRQTQTVSLPGQFRVDGLEIEVYTRGFEFWDGKETGEKLRFRFAGDSVRDVLGQDGNELDLLRLEPPFLGAIYPGHQEDRVLINLSDSPELLVKGLLAIEDRRFYEHSGVSLTSIARAMYTNFRAGARVQGGSTITQQLVKNFFLSNTKSYWRKINEAFMALLLEMHYAKDEILEAYLNEVYLGQEGQRAVHGFGLASWFYFARPVAELKTREIALLIAMVKGASWYDPRRFPDRARERRDLVLQTLAEQQLISQNEALIAMQADLGVIKNKPSGLIRYPDYIGVVKQQLFRDYSEKDLQSSGLRIFTNLDPVVQELVQEVADKGLSRLERDNGLEKNSLQTAIVITKRNTAELVALTGSRNAGFAGLNRARDIERAIGSLVKPAIYMEALSQPDEYHLGTMIDDSAIEVELDSGDIWRPQNYDNTEHGPTPFYTALSHSYNLAAVRLGMDLGVEKVNERLNSLGIEKDLPPYPANLLGAVDLSPLEVAQMFQTIADNGYLTPLRAIRSVTTGDGKPLTRYGIDTKEVVDPVTAYLISASLQNVVKSGTAHRLSEMVDRDLNIAGKTGTTNDKRDSWFAGYSDKYVGVSWLGKDDFTPTPFSGSTGAMRLWGQIFASIENSPMSMPVPDEIEYMSFVPTTGERVDAACSTGVDIPVKRDTINPPITECKNNSIINKTHIWLKQLF